MTKGLSVVNQLQKLGEWVERGSACRNSRLSVRAWCQKNGVSEQTYYRWQRRLYELAQHPQENRFAEVTPQVHTPPKLSGKTGEVEHRFR